MMIARSILDLAPHARLYDVPAVPLNPTPLPVFVSTMHAACGSLIHEIHHRQKLPQWSGPWVLVNAWGVFDTSADPTGGYTENTAVHGHPLINLVTHAVQHRHLDMVFAAGNCGQFCPSQRCGGRDRGPGHSIWGANAHPLVITAGAVRSDETWIGYSSQGPGPELLAVQKPDLCAPSQFCETYDAASLSSGTSAACAIIAGVVAALRGNPKWDQVTVTPEALKAALIASARKPLGPAGWDERLGFGILDAAATIAALPD
jgi:subtilisin family serine protease